MILHFFGLGDSAAQFVAREVFILCYHGQGGFTYSDVYYNIPVFKRKFYIKQINDEIEKRNKAEEELAKKANSKMKIR